jgi:hypothetical protein
MQAILSIHSSLMKHLRSFTPQAGIRDDTKNETLRPESSKNGVTPGLFTLHKLSFYPLFKSCPPLKAEKTLLVKLTFTSFFSAKRIIICFYSKILLASKITLGYIVG